MQQLTGYQAWRPTIAVQSNLDMLVTLFAAAFAGLALPVERMGPIVLAFSQLPEADMRQALEQLGRQEVLAAIKAHSHLKGYLDTEAPAGYLLIKPRSNPHEFIRRCQALGFTVTTL